MAAKRAEGYNRISAQDMHPAMVTSGNRGAILGSTERNNKKEEENAVTGSQIDHRMSERTGLDTVFGYPGGAILNVYDELYKHQNEIHIF